MTDHDLRSLLDDAIPEPDRGVSVPAVMRLARRRVYRRRSVTAGGLAAVGAVAATTIPGLVASPAHQTLSAPPSAAPAPRPSVSAAPSSRPSATSARTSPPLAPPTLETPQTEEGPVVDWDAPLTDGITTAVAKLTVAGNLPFPLFIPHFSVRPVRAEVTRPDTTAVAKRVVLHYDFGVSTDFPKDGRVVVNESPTAFTAADLDTIGVGSPGVTNKAITVPGAAAAVLLTANGEGSVLFVRNGTMVDISGPALSPSMAVKLSALF